MIIGLTFLIRKSLLTIFIYVCIFRQISNGTESLRAGRWDRKKFMGNEVYGKTLAIIGLGRIGQEVASRMRSFGMEVSKTFFKQ